MNESLFHTPRLSLERFRVLLLRGDNSLIRDLLVGRENAYPNLHTLATTDTVNRVYSYAFAFGRYTTRIQ